MNWNKVQVVTENGDRVMAQAPVIISASRSTDIPAFYSEWFIERLKKGHIAWKNPYNGKKYYVSFENARAFIFWSKNPKPLMKHLGYLDEHGYNYYFQYTLNDYENDNLELSLLPLQNRIDTFIELSEKIGKEKVIWRFDPYILTKTTGVEELLRRTENIGNQLKGYTDKLVFSFIDIEIYKKVKKNLISLPEQPVEFTEKTMNELAAGLMELNKKWKFEIGTCAEKIDLDKYGIIHNKCIDDDLMVKLFSNDKKLMDFIGYEPAVQTSMFDTIKKDQVKINPDNKIAYKFKAGKDKGQRLACGCIMSKDIGQYNTCIHDCVYCYANTSMTAAKKNYLQHKQNPAAETITGE